jgi:hypothetical protein
MTGIDGEGRYIFHTGYVVWAYDAEQKIGI